MGNMNDQHRNCLAMYWNFWRFSFGMIFIFVSCCRGQDEICRSQTALQSCNQCIKEDSRCVWCTDPAFDGGYRCDVETNLIDSCPPQFLYQAKSNVQLTENVEAGSYEPKHGRVRQTQPQQVHVLIKPGDTVTFPFKYYHVPHEERDVFLLNSETESQGVTLTFNVDCKGIHKSDRECKGVRNSDLIIYNVSVQIAGCSSNAVVSVGVSGVREVTALYIHPQCGCDCERPEKQEVRSGHCNGWGTLVCGACICDDARKGGRHCECDLAPAQTTAQIEDQCREDPSKPLCGGHGHCNCGVCQCDTQYSGKYCDCSYAPCPVAENGEQCAGRGTCNCGKCECESAWSGPTCSCSTDTESCLSHDGKFCSGHGTCLCNKCNCLPGYEGAHCEHQTGGVASTAKPDETKADDDQGDDQDDHNDDRNEMEDTITESPFEHPEHDPVAEPEPEPAPETEDTDVSETTAESHDESSTVSSGSHTATLLNFFFVLWAFIHLR